MSNENRFADLNVSIEEILPHRYPFLLVDRVLEIQEGEDPKARVGRFCRAIKNVTVNEPFFQGHFPGFPVMPGVLLVEAMAQVGGIACFIPGDPPRRIMIARINQARFRQPVVPGDQVVLTSKVLRQKRHILVIECTASVEGSIVAETEVVAHVSPMDS